MNDLGAAILSHLVDVYTSGKLCGICHTIASPAIPVPCCLFLLCETCLDAINHNSVQRNTPLLCPNCRQRLSSEPLEKLFQWLRDQQHPGRQANQTRSFPLQTPITTLDALENKLRVDGQRHTALSVHASLQIPSYQYKYVTPIQNPRLKQLKVTLTDATAASLKTLSKLLYGLHINESLECVILHLTLKEAFTRRWSSQ